MMVSHYKQDVELATKKVNKIEIRIEKVKRKIRMLLIVENLIVL